MILTNAACEEGEGMADVNGDGEETQVIEWGHNQHETKQTKIEIEIDNQSNPNFLWYLGVDGWHAQRRHAVCWGWRYKIYLQIESEPLFELKSNLRTENPKSRTPFFV